MEHNIEVMEGTRFPLCVTLKDGEGNALAGDGFRVYGGAVCPGMGAVAFPVTRSGGDFVVMVPGLAVGRMPWRYQVFVVEQATGVEWLLCSGEVRPESRCADASGGVAAGSLTVTGVLDKQTLSLGVQLGESTELCRSLVARAEEAARRAEEAAAGASFTLTAEEVQKVVPMKWEGDMVQVSATGGSALALGSGSSATGGTSMAIGYRAEVSGVSGLAVGDRAKVSRQWSTAVGFSAMAQGNSSAAYGHSATADSFQSTALGCRAGARGDSSLAAGVGTVANGGGSVAVGSGANGVGYSSVAVGCTSYAGSSYDVAIGYEAKTLNGSALAVGAQTRADGESAVALGGDARAWSTHTMALGGGARANDFYSFSVGAEAEANGSSSAAIGIGAKADRSGELVISASNRAAQTRLSLALVAGAATGGSGSVCGIDAFMDGDVIFTCRDDLSGLEHSVQFALYDFVRFLESIPGSIVRVGVVESGDIYGYGYGY